MSDFADLMNAPKEVAYGGKVYPLRELTFEERAKFSRVLEKRARDRLGRSRGDMPEDDWREWAAVTGAKIDAGEYEYGGATYNAALGTVFGWAQTLVILFRGVAGYEEMTEEFATRMVADLVGERLFEELKKIQDSWADPGNSSAPGAPSAPPGTSSKSSATSRSARRRKKSRR